MAAGGLLVTLLLAAALMVAHAMPGGQRRPVMVGAPQKIADAGNDEGLQRALHFAMAKYNEGSNDMYSSRVVRIISAERQIVAGVKYIIEVEIGRTTCTKPAADLQDCAFYDAPQMAQHTICKFVVYTIPWQNETKLLESKCQ